MKHGIDNIPTESKGRKEGDSTTSQKGGQENSETGFLMNNFGRILLSICGVQMAALVIMALFAWKFISELPEKVSENHDAILTGRVMLEVQGHLIKENAASNQAMAVDQKAIEKALTILSGDVKALRASTQSSTELINAKLDYTVEAWREYRNSGSITYEQNN